MWYPDESQSAIGYGLDTNLLKFFCNWVGWQLIHKPQPNPPFIVLSKQKARNEKLTGRTILVPRDFENYTCRMQRYQIHLAFLTIRRWIQSIMYSISDAHQLHVAVVCKLSPLPSSHYRIVTTCSIVPWSNFRNGLRFSRSKAHSVWSYSILPLPQGLACQYWQFESYGVFIQKIPHPSFEKRGPPGWTLSEEWLKGACHRLTSMSLRS